MQTWGGGGLEHYFCVCVSLQTKLGGCKITTVGNSVSMIISKPIFLTISQSEAITITYLKLFLITSQPLSPRSIDIHK